MKTFHKWLKKYFVPHTENNYHPHLLRHQTISIILLIIIVVEVGFFVQVFYIFDKTKFLASVLPGVLTSMTNDERQDFNLQPLSENPLLTKAAQLKAEDMAKNGYFAHTSPDGKTPWYWFDQVGYDYTYAGENLAVNFSESADVSDAWMNSPTHKANIIKPNYTEIGIGVANGVFEGRHTVFVAQLFGTPAQKVSVVNETILPEDIKKAEKVTDTPKATEDTQVEQTEVLGEEITPEPELIVENIVSPQKTTSIAPVKAVQESTIKSSMREALTSPGKSVGYLYTVLGIFTALAVALAIFIKSEVRHPGMVARGVGLVVIIILLSALNFKIIEVKPKLPSVELGANSIEVFIQ